jgi:hypothetical protein
MKTYKICSFINKNYEKWYQIKIKNGWWPSYYYASENYANYDELVWFRKPDKFKNIQSVQQKIKELIEEEKSSIITQL